MYAGQVVEVVCRASLEWLALELMLDDGVGW